MTQRFVTSALALANNLAESPQRHFRESGYGAKQ
jgi:hypothetical protein